MRPETLIEVADVRSAVRSIQRHGFALWRGMIDRDSALLMAESAKASDNYVSRDYGTLHLSALGRDPICRAISDVFTEMLGQWVCSPDESPVFYSRAGTTPTHWHQDACVNRYRTAIVWVALSDCGVDSPGLKLVLRHPGRPLDLFLDEHAAEEPKEAFIRSQSWPVYRPIFAAGDALFFDHLSIHGTHVPPGADKSRVSFKITARKHHQNLP